mgnify:CR=1 FL=1
MSDNYKIFSEGDVTRSMIKLAIPSVLMAMVDLICNMVNQIFIGQMGSTAMISSISVPSSLTMFVFAVGEAIGVSASSYMGRQLGARNEKGVNSVLRTAMTLTLLISTAMVVVTELVLKPYASWQTKDAEVVMYALRYGRIVLVSSIFQVVRNLLTYCLRAVGDIRFSTVVVIGSIVLNVILDPFLMFDWGLGLNVTGVALATVISQLLAMAALLYRAMSGRTPLRLKLFDFAIDRRIAAEIGKVGAAVYLRDALPSLSMTIMVKIAFSFGTAFEAACSIGRYAIYFVNFFINGITASFLPFAAFNYGARSYARLRRGLMTDMWIIIGYSLLTTVGLYVWAGPLFALFDPGDTEALGYGVLFLRAYAYSLPIYGFYHMSLTMLQAAGMGGSATVISICRQAVFYIPVIIVAVRLWGQAGVYATQPICDWCSAALAVALCWPLLRQIWQGSSPSIQG